VIARGNAPRDRGPLKQGACQAPVAAGAAETALAPLWHTALLVALILSVACTGLLLQYRGVTVSEPAVRAGYPSRIWVHYLPLLVVNLALTAYSCCLFRQPNALGALLGNIGWGRTVKDLAAAGLILVLVQGAEFAYSSWFSAGQGTPHVAALLPTSPLERAVWVLVAVTVGFCEEVVYRGYLQTQLGAFTGRGWLGVLLQAALFGLAHAEQGRATALRILVYGLLLGGVAKRSRSLAPSILAHIGIDLTSAFLR